MNLKITLVTLFVAFNFSFLLAQEGVVRGTITDENGIYVPGASVMIEELKKGTVTNFDGEFTLLEIPEGTYELSVQYLGYQTILKEVKVEASKTVSMKLLLNTTETTLGTVQITGRGLSAQARALNLQKNKTNITNIVSTEQIGKFPDANIGDVAKRIPGITMQVDQGEARNIIVRGLAPQLNSVTLNGSRIPSAEGDNRNIQMDLIPSDMIQTIEVSKAVTPDMDADALGGAVNLITRSAPEGFRLSATAGSGINFITNKRILNGAFLIGDRTKDGKFGFMLSASINDNDFGSDNVEADWTDKFEYNAGDPDNLEKVGVNPFVEKFEIRKYLVQRVRRSFSANFDYRFNDNNSIYFKSMYNWRDDRENRFALTSEILDSEDIEEGDFEVTNGNLTRFPAEITRETKGGTPGGRIKNRRLEDQRMQNYTLGGNHIFGNLKLDWMGSYAKASEERPNERYVVYASEYQVNNHVSNSRKPLHTALGNPDLSGFELDELTEEYQYTEEEDINVFVNAELPSDFFGNGDGIIKFGVRGRFKNKYRDNNFFEYEPIASSGLNIESLANINTRNYNGNDFLAGKQYIPGAFASPKFLGNLDLHNSNLFKSEAIQDEYLSENFEVKENVYAAYAMTNQKLTDKLNILAGVRVEATKIESTGNEVIYNEEGDYDGSMEVTDKSDYVNILPSIHFKYDLNEKTVLRFAWTNTLSRPNYLDLVPYYAINNEDEEIVVGNTELNPTTSMNFDFMAEYYFNSVGLLSGGVFYKDINDFVYTYVVEDAVSGYKVFQPLNGDKASIYGAEISFQQQLNFLPGFAKKFSLYANYTYLHSTANGIRNEDGDERGELDLPGSSPNMFNASLSYADKKLSVRLSANFSDAYLDELGGNAFEDRYYDEQFFLDFNVNYAINKNLTLYGSLNNITNQPLRYYQGVSSRTMQMEYYERRLTLGIKYDLY